MEQNKIKLRELLIKKKYNLNEKINIENFYIFLDKLKNEYFDRNIAQQLFEKMEFKNTGFSNLNKFIEVYLEAIQSLNNKIEESENNIINLENFLEEFYKEKEELDKFPKSDYEEGMILFYKLVKIEGNFEEDLNFIIRYGDNFCKVILNNFENGDYK